MMQGILYLLGNPRFWIRLFLNSALFMQFHCMIGLVLSFIVTNIHDSGNNDIENIIDHLLPLCIGTLIFLLLEYWIFLWIARKRSLRYALTVLVGLNAVQSLIWLIGFSNPFTLIRLIPPTFFDLIVIGLLISYPKCQRMKVESFFTMIFRWMGRFYLNIRVGILALSGKWFDPSQIRKDYDDLATHYDDSWLIHLKETTGSLISILPPILRSNTTLLDLGCGTGWSTRQLADRYPDTNVIGVDLSPGMLQEARKRTEGIKNVHLLEGDLLIDLQKREADSVDMIFSAWAIGYSDPDQFVREAFRVLRKDGLLAVVVNKRDTLPAVFDAYRKTMYRFPHLFQKAYLPKFPVGSSGMKSRIIASGFEILCFQDIDVPIPIPPEEKRLDGLLNTGVLAGFDELLPIRTNIKVRNFFSRELDSSDLDWEHHGLVFLARKGS